MEEILIIFFVFGQFTVISSALDGKNYSKLKSFLIGLYLLIGINIPIALEVFLTIKLKTKTPILSLCMTFYEWGLCLIGATAIGFSIYKGVKNHLLPSMFGLIKKFRRAAVLTDKNWIKKASEFEGMLIPGLEIKAFNRDQKEEAEIWLSE